MQFSVWLSPLLSYIVQSLLTIAAGKCCCLIASMIGVCVSWNCSGLIIIIIISLHCVLTLLVGQQEGHLVCKKLGVGLLW